MHSAQPFVRLTALCACFLSLAQACAASNAGDETLAASADTLQAYEYYSDLGMEFDATGCAEIGLDAAELSDAVAVEAASAQIRRVAAIAFTDLAQYQRNLFALVSLHR